MSVDGKDCNKREKRPMDTKEASVKLKHASWKYELAIGIVSGLIHWVNGPFRGGKHDRTIFREDGLEDALEDWEIVEGDLGYEGCAKVKDKEVYLTRADGHKKATVRSRHETIDSRFSNFGFVAKMFWHNKEMHWMCFRAVGVVVQVGLMHTPLWEVDYDIDYNDTESMFN
mmetsp:Transcript_19902/g.47919  ORF Transcript_19902/g.47919 Transcript_19902/m.47919 type:complete len:171 (-) Transcript_19902:70-582(-)